MMTVVTNVTLKEGVGPEWDTAMRERLDAARGRPGWVRGQLLMPLEDVGKRAIIGTWKTRADWEAWHQDETFARTRQRLAELESGPSQTLWFEIIAEQSPASVTDRVAGFSRRITGKAKGGGGPE
jgi:heme-degrading monooxygenase HmoA